ncbi:hypothetical protein QTP86_000117 [Hemibagrus guttatus]|nr:hypothetical protein QTP86_000117 [Hemibagrus guttatus]
MTSTAKPQSRMTSTAEPQDQAMSTAEQQLRATSTAEHSPRATSTDERRLRGDDVRLAGVWNSPRGGRAGAGCCRNSPPLATVMDQLSEEVRQESPWTMMFADDIVICSESREQVEENLERWRFALERRGMKVSRSKTEYISVNEREGSGTVRLQGEEVKKVQEFKYLGQQFRVEWRVWERVEIHNSDDVVLLAPSSQDLHHAQGHFAAECEVVGMRVSTSKSVAMVLNQKKVACILPVGGEFLPQVEEFKYLGVLFTKEGWIMRLTDESVQWQQ